jgi:hypothetical protein
MSSTRHQRFIRSLALASLVALAGLVTANASLAEVAVIETTVPLQDGSEAGINAAVLAALDSAVREAAARGFQWIRPLAAFLSADRVGIQVLATTEPLKDAEETPRPGVQLPAGEKYQL